MSDKPYWMVRRDLKNGKTASADPGKGGTNDDLPKKDESPAKGTKPGKGPKKPLKKASKKRAKELRAYKPVRKKFLSDHPLCGLKLPGCTGQASEIHHQSGREGKRLLDITDFIGACHSCHVIATKDSREAIAAGHSKTRLGKPNKQ